MVERLSQQSDLSQEWKLYLCFSVVYHFGFSSQVALPFELFIVTFLHMYICIRFVHSSAFLDDRSLLVALKCCNVTHHYDRYQIVELFSIVGRELGMVSTFCLTGVRWTLGHNNLCLLKLVPSHLCLVYKRLTDWLAVVEQPCRHSTFPSSHVTTISRASERRSRSETNFDWKSGLASRRRTYQGNK